MEQISKEFIDAMNGVLNGESWHRKSYGYKEYISLNQGKIALYTMGKDNYNTGMFREEFIEYIGMTLEDMQATDWVKVEEKPIQTDITDFIGEK